MTTAQAVMFGAYVLVLVALCEGHRRRRVLALAIAESQPPENVKPTPAVVVEFAKNGARTYRIQRNTSKFPTYVGVGP